MAEVEEYHNMVQIIKTEDPRGRLSEMLGMSLGQGISNGLNTFFANRSLESVMKDKSLEGAPLSKKLEATRKALSYHGEKGKEIFQQRLEIENHEYQEKLAREAQKAAIDREKRLFQQQKELQSQKDIAAKERAGLKAAPMGERPVPQDQIDAMQRARGIPGYEQMTESKKYETLIDNGVSGPNAIREATLRSQQAQREDQKFESSYKAQERFIDDVTKSYKGFETEMKPRLLQMQHMKPEEIVSPTAATFLEALHIPLGALENPSSELYNKLSQDLLKGLPETYGSRILKVEVDNFLKTIPTLLNSPDGRRMIASNMLKLGEMKEVYYNAMRDKQREYLDEGRPFPRDFQQVIFDQVKPQIDRINNEFVQMSDVKSVPQGTIPFFGPDGQIKFIPKDKSEEASKRGGKRIW